jgi:hypothetical protein
VEVLAGEDGLNEEVPAPELIDEVGVFAQVVAVGREGAVAGDSRDG